MNSTEKKTLSHNLFYSFVPLLVALIAHGSGVVNGFSFDDFTVLVDHPVVNGSVPLSRIFHYTFVGIPIEGGPPTFRPFTTFLFAIEWKIWGNRPALFHVMSLAWFLGLVWWVQVVFRNFLTEKQALLGAVIFACMAIHVSDVAAIAHRSEILAMLFSLVALHKAINKRLLQACLFYLLAMLSKESATFMPFLLLSYYLSQDGLHFLKERPRRMAFLVLCCVAVVFVYIRFWWLPIAFANRVILADNPILGQPFEIRAWIPFVLLGRYIRLLFLPFNYAVDYTYSVIPMVLDFSDVYGWLGFVTIVSFSVALLFFSLRKSSGVRRAVLFSIFAFFTSYVIYSNSFLLITVLMAERLFLGPSIWIALLLTVLGSTVYQQFQSVRRPLIVFIGGFCLLQLFGANVRTSEWRNDFTLFSALIRVHPNALRGHKALAGQYDKRGNPKEAVWHLALAIHGRNTYPKGFVKSEFGRGMGAWLKGEDLRYRPWVLPVTQEQMRWPIEKRLKLIPGFLAKYELSKRDAMRLFREIVLKEFSSSALAVVDGIYVP